MFRKSALILVFMSFLLSACEPGQLFSPTLTPTPTITPTSTLTPTATLTPTLTLTPTATFTRIPSPTPVVYDGTWSGKTSSGGKIAFKVVKNGIASFTISFYTKIKNGSCDVSMNVAISPYLDITNDRFNIQGTGITVSGNFDSSSSAVGTVQAAANTARCSGGVSLTWTAQRK